MHDPRMTRDMPARRSPAGDAGRALLSSAALAALLGSCAAPPPPPATEVQAVWMDELPDGPEDALWRDIPVYSAAMIPQDLVEPRLLAPSTPLVGVQAAHDGARVAFRLTWNDKTLDETPGPALFSDAVAIQLPQRVQPDLPDPQMGNPGRPVEVTFWRASWQAAVAGRPDTIQSLYPGAIVDHYPFEAPSLPAGSEEQKVFAARYAPAAALGARREGPRDKPVEDLVAEGPGTLRPADRMTSDGAGHRTEAGWEVLIVRTLPEGLAAGARSQIAVAVWDGAQGEVGARKMRSAWVPLFIEPPANSGGAPGAHGSTP